MDSESAKGTFCCNHSPTVTDLIHWQGVESFLRRCSVLRTHPLHGIEVLQNLPAQLPPASNWLVSNSAPYLRYAY